MHLASRLAALGLASALLLATGCPNKDQERCEKMTDKAFEIAQEMTKALSKMMPAEKVAEMNATMEAEMKKNRPQMVQNCLETVKENPEIVEVMDCAIAAPDLQAASKCDPEGKLRKLAAPPPPAK
ncbi:MAG: hypothetical protein P1V51_15515 [Deltaproteobacteria bacterium]|nr:hypothetical protein [Deltaproteobacteria bacterium]